MAQVMQKNHRAAFPFFNEVVADLFNDMRLAVGNDQHANVAVNILEDEKGYGLEVAAPGLAKEDFKIDIEKNLLTISTAKQEEAQEAKVKYRRREFTFSRFSRSFRLPETIDQENIQAKYEAGILKLFLPFREDLQHGPRKINVS